jgi:hypothetical protein
MRASIVWPPPRLQSIRTSMAVCHSGNAASFFARLVMWVAASLSLNNFRPFGSGIGSLVRRGPTQCHQPSLSTSALKPSGIRGSSLSLVPLQAGQGAPGARHRQACGPSRGL